jgi:hypothetical protein
MNSGKIDRQWRYLYRRKYRQGDLAHVTVWGHYKYANKWFIKINFKDMNLTSNVENILDGTIESLC